MVILHPSAAENFNEKAELLTQRIQEVEYPRDNADFIWGTHNEHSPSARVSEDIFGFRVNYRGDITARYFRYQGRVFGVIDNDYNELAMLSHAIYKLHQFKKLISIETLSRVIFEWMVMRFFDKTGDKFDKYLVATCEKLVEECEIWFPIASLHVESDFQIGSVAIRPITNALLDKWEDKALKDTSPERRENLKKEFSKQRCRLQGIASASVKVRAESQRAFEIAFDEAERALSLLRVFSPTNMLADAICYCTLLGRENIESVTMLTVKNGDLYRITERLLNRNYKEWELSNSDLDTYREIGLSKIHEMLIADSLTDFQQNLLDALLYYSRSSLSKTLSDKLLYILVALESFLLKNSNEPIQQNISERLAIFIGNSIQEKKMIIRLVKDIYAVRSAFVHHGSDVKEEDAELMTAFMQYASAFFIRSSRIKIVLRPKSSFLTF